MNTISLEVCFQIKIIIKKKIECFPMFRLQIELMRMLSYLSEAGKFTDTFMCVVVDPLKLVRSEFASAGKQLVRPLKFT